MASRESGRSPDRLQQSHVLRVLRVEADSSHIVRTLSRHYGGCFTHYKGGTKYCPGREDCRLHNLDTMWKGYALVESWQGDGVLWLPHVLEITESLELDFRDRFDRGQVWELKRLAAPKKGKHPPTRGRLLEERDPDTFPPEFDFTAVLLHLYHVTSIRLDKTNPLPPRMLIGPSQGAPPVDPTKPADRQEPLRGGDIKQLLANAKERMSIPIAGNGNGNGNGHQ